MLVILTLTSKGREEKLSNLQAPSIGSEITEIEKLVGNEYLKLRIYEWEIQREEMV